MTTIPEQFDATVAGALDPIIDAALSEVGWRAVWRW